VLVAGEAMTRVHEMTVSDLGGFALQMPRSSTANAAALDSASTQAAKTSVMLDT
jgi:hypothetical protein